MPVGETSSFPKFDFKKKAKVEVYEKDVRQSSLSITMQAPNYDDESVAQEDLALNCIAYGEMSPLYQELVATTNIASAVSGSTMYFNQGGAHFLKASLSY